LRVRQLDRGSQPEGEEPEDDYRAEETRDEEANVNDFPGGRGRSGADHERTATGSDVAPIRAERVERLRVSGNELWSRLRQLVREGNVRRLIIRDDEERILVEIPMTVGVVALVLAPFAVAIGAIAALLTRCTIEIERLEEEARAGSAARGGASRLDAEHHPVAEPLSAPPTAKAAESPPRRRRRKP
jgi:hypothetical protein